MYPKLSEALGQQICAVSFGTPVVLFLLLQKRVREYPSREDDLSFFWIPLTTEFLAVRLCGTQPKRANNSLGPKKQGEHTKKNQRLSTSFSPSSCTATLSHGSLPLPPAVLITSFSCEVFVCFSFIPCVFSPFFGGCFEYCRQ